MFIRCTANMRKLIGHRFHISRQHTVTTNGDNRHGRPSDKSIFDEKYEKWQLFSLYSQTPKSGVRTH